MIRLTVTAAALACGSAAAAQELDPVLEFCAGVPGQADWAEGMSALGWEPVADFVTEDIARARALLHFGSRRAAPGPDDAAEEREQVRLRTESYLEDLAGEGPGGPGIAVFRNGETLAVLSEDSRLDADLGCDFYFTDLAAAEAARAFVEGARLGVFDSEDEGARFTNTDAFGERPGLIVADVLTLDAEAVSEDLGFTPAYPVILRGMWRGEETPPPEPPAPADPNSPLGSAVSICTEPTTRGAAKREALIAFGWQPSAPEEADLAGLAGAHIGSIAGTDAPVQILSNMAPELQANFTNLANTTPLEIFTRDGAVLAFWANEAAPGVENLSCYFAGPAGSGIAAYWNPPNPDPQPQSGTTGTMFQGTVMDMSAGYTYQEYQLYLQVSPDLSPLTDSFRYERIQQQ